MVLSIRIDKDSVVGKIGQGMRSCKCTNHDLCTGGCQWQWKVCVRDTMLSVCMSVCVWCCCIVHDLRLDTLQSGYRPPWTPSSSLLLLWSKNCESVSVWSVRLSSSSSPSALTSSMSVVVLLSRCVWVFFSFRVFLLSITDWSCSDVLISYSSWKVTSPDEELNTILRHPSALDFTDEILCLNVWFLKDVLTSSSVLRLLTHRLSTLMLGGLGLLVSFTLSHTLFHSICLFGWHHNSLSSRVSSPRKKICFFPRLFVFLRIFFPSCLVREDPILLSSVRCVLLYVSGRCRK